MAEVRLTEIVPAGGSSNRGGDQRAKSFISGAPSCRKLIGMKATVFSP